MTLEERLAEHFETDAFAVSRLKARLGFSDTPLTFDQGVELVEQLIGTLYGPFDSGKAFTLDAAKKAAYMIKDPDYGDINEYFENLTFPITDRFNYEVLRTLADWYHKNEWEMPTQLQRFVTSEYLEPSVPNWPKKKPRDMGVQIVFLVLHLTQSGLDATRNADGKRKDSACDAVARAMAKKRLRPQSYEGVEAIWKNRKQIMPSYFS